LLTIGQYLQPSRGHLPVERFVPPETFDEYARLAREMGFRNVASGPLVRSSYHAEQQARSAGDHR
jgi:lipoic acid synthetase